VRIGLVWLLVAVIVVIAVWWLLPWIRRKWLKGYRTPAQHSKLSPYIVNSLIHTSVSTPGPIDFDESR
jgi:hypothetical protein